MLRIARRIRSVLADLDRLTGRVSEGWRRFQQSSDDYYLDGVALNMHGFYAGLERIFELIAIHVDGFRPAGENWHQTLLIRMATEQPSVRPAVISESLHEQLNEYRGFRHVVRNVYSFEFESAKIQKMVVQLPSVYNQVRNELEAFTVFLEQRA
ncbi:MAG TPA: hypothetical protein PK878_17095 [bacterium]|nr:hypothetical protein [Candidatus Omnitrophota bacterium]HOJ62002.1 hypothetical protein [bacterium]HOL96711.1 hypothetical protein [bacterium]HPP01797.1 hypothetical protein [bacterium]